MCIIFIILLYLYYLREMTLNISMSAGVFPGLVTRNSLYQGRNKLVTPMRPSDRLTTGALGDDCYVLPPCQRTRWTKGIREASSSSLVLSSQLLKNIQCSIVYGNQARMSPMHDIPAC